MQAAESSCLPQRASLIRQNHFLSLQHRASQPHTARSGLPRSWENSRDTAGASPCSSSPSAKFLWPVLPPPCPAFTQSRVAYTATQLLSAVFVGKRGLKGKALGEKGERGALPLFYLCLCSCMQCNNGVQCPGEPITSRSTAKQGLGHSPLNFLYTVSSSQKSTAAKEKEQSRLPAQTYHPR